MTKRLTNAASIPLNSTTTKQRNAAMNNNQQISPEEEQQRQLIGDTVGIYCELPEEKRQELITAIQEIRNKNQAHNDEISERVKQMSPEDYERFMCFLRAMLDGDIETLEAIKTEHSQFDNPVADDLIERIKQGKPTRHIIKPIPQELPALEKRPILLHNISRMSPAECDFVLNLLTMGDDAA